MKTQPNNKLHDKINNFAKEITNKFMDLEAEMDLNNLKKGRASIFHKLLKFFGTLNKEIKKIETEKEKLISENKKLMLGKKNFEVLYTSGVMLGAETERSSLLKLALNTIVREIKADNGFIVITEDGENYDEVISHNLDSEGNEDAKSICFSVISKTIKNLNSINNKSIKDEISFITKSSSTGFGLKNELCIPLLEQTKLLGALYIDRDDPNRIFSDTDLAFLISFSKQITSGLVVAKQISELKSSLVGNFKQKLFELRKDFKSDKIIGNSRKMYESLCFASKISKSNINVFLLGENGTGKDLFAHAIHQNSLRANKPFISINCGAIPADLLESELFGYEEGAYTGAVKNKPGRLEVANGGTIFLDEVTEMPISLQTKLLRVVQNKEVQRLGSLELKKIDVRFISATNKNIKDLIEQQLFREDLYYRLKVIEIELPALSERKEDIEELAYFFIQKHCDKNRYTLSNEVLEALEDYDWPGNVRELENIIQRCMALSSHSILTPDDLPPEIISNHIIQSSHMGGSKIKTLSEAETEFRKKYIRRILRETKSKSEAAEVLGINRSHLHKLLAQLELY